MKEPLYILLFTLFCSVWNIHSQTSDSLQKTNLRFASKNELGGLIGMGHIQGLDDVVIKNPERALELTSTNGMEIKQWFLGVGLGVRAWRKDFTVPMFFHVSLDDLWRSGFFLHGDLGGQLGIRRNQYGDREITEFYAAYGLGYNFPVKRQNLYLKASVCHQKANAEGTYSGLGPSTMMEGYTLNYLFFRVSVGLKITK